MPVHVSTPLGGSIQVSAKRAWFIARAHAVEAATTTPTTNTLQPFQNQIWPTVLRQSPDEVKLGL